MFSFGIRYLCGRAIATHSGDRTRAEWPPHPDRVFMALVAAHFETGSAQIERDALLWLEQQPPPALVASACAERSLVTHFVPVNDSGMPRIKDAATATDALVKGGLELLPEHRLKQPRQFPSAIPENEVFFVVWSVKPPATHRQVLGELCRKVTYVGHSASLVQMWVEEAPMEPTLIPVGNGIGRFRMRVTGPGRLSQLEARFAAQMRPVSSLWTGYAAPKKEEATAPIRSTVFDQDILVMRRLEGRPLGLESTLQVTRALRDTLMSICPVQPPPEWLSGHTLNGKPSEQAHVAFLPLAHVGHEHADGHLLGLGLAVPRKVGAEEQMRCWRKALFDEFGLPTTIELRMGGLGVWQLELDDRADRPVALRPETWTATSPASPACRWATVTPIALDRHPKEGDKWEEIQQTISRACVRIGLPEPTVVVPTPVSVFIGAPLTRVFPPIVRKAGGGQILHAHAIITFPEPVCGPVLLGAGRYRGYGLCRPFGAEELLP